MNGLAWSAVAFLLLTGAFVWHLYALHRGEEDE